VACVHWPEVRLPCPVAHTGAPLGGAVARGSALTPGEARAALGLPPDARTVLVMGGSQGARALNEWLREGVQAALPAGPPLAFVHLAGSEAAVPGLQDAYRCAGAPHRVLPFLDEVGLAYRAADLAIVRGGAATLAELLACGLPGLVVPLPSSAGDHQRANARAFAALGAGQHLEEAALSLDALGAALRLVRERAALSAMRRSALAAGRPEAARTVVRVMEQLARERTGGVRPAAGSARSRAA
jgi:UDP-N-acetylglucosamine--N-acetylmuramyl-(pentapeptide) pyrophosphoryl-undecaprenol N-acetylglucosamine transferase